MEKEMLNMYLESNPEKFDFTNDCTEDVEYAYKAGYDKYFAYKTQSGVGDPDAKSILLQEIYKVLWEEDVLSKEWMCAKGWFYSDTMTSVQFTMSEYFKDKFEKEIIEYKRDNPCQRQVSAKMCKEMYEKNPTVKKMLNESRGFLEFVSVYHTIGNYVPVPKGFNCARSGWFGSHDYWDLTLMKIKEYYDNKNVQSKKTIQLETVLDLFHVANPVDACRKWLDSYKDWKEFVNFNFFQDYVDESNNWNVKPFCKGHSWENNKITDYEEFFSNVVQCIEGRGKRMINELSKKLKEE